MRNLEAEVPAEWREFGPMARAPRTEMRTFSTAAMAPGIAPGDLLPLPYGMHAHRPQSRLMLGFRRWGG